MGSGSMRSASEALNNLNYWHILARSYTFDSSKYANRSGNVTYGTHERYIWELISPSLEDPIYQRMPSAFRSEFNDRLMAPIYPFAFAAITFVFLGTPRTTRQSRNFSIGCSITAVFGLRMAGYVCTVMGGKSELAILFQYLMLVSAIGSSIWIIVRGVKIEPPVRLLEAINHSNGRLLRLLRQER